MGLFVPSGGGFNYVTGNVLTTRPGGTFGTVITPAQNAYGLYTEILSDASVTKDCFGVMLNINGINTSNNIKDSLTTIGIDTAGGTSYVDLIPNLLTSCAAAYANGMGGHWYYFPLYIPAGSAIAAKGSVNNATVGTQRVAIWLYGAPANPATVYAGQGVESIGVTLASSSGTAVTAGTTNDGAWTSLGTTTKKCFAWAFGMGVADASLSAGGLYHGDLSYGDGTNQIIIDQDKYFHVNATAEDLSGQLRPPAYCDVPAGGGIYGRLQCSGTADSALSMAAYGVY